MSGWGGWFDFGLTVPMDSLLQTEGFGGIKDLTKPDGSFVLPVLIGLMNVTNIEVMPTNIQLPNPLDDCCQTIGCLDI